MRPWTRLSMCYVVIIAAVLGSSSSSGEGIALAPRRHRSLRHEDNAGVVSDPPLDAPPGDAPEPEAPLAWEISSGALAPANCDRLLVFALPKSGIGSDVLRTVGALAMAQATRRAFVFSGATTFPWSRGCPIPRVGWDCFFANVSQCAEPELEAEAGQALPELAPATVTRGDADADARPVVLLKRAKSSWPGFWSAVHHVAEGIRARRLMEGKVDAFHGYYGKRHQHTGEMREIVHALWNMRPWFRKRVEERLTALNVIGDGAPKYVAVLHIRRGDKKKEAKYVPVRKYVKAAQRQMQRVVKKQTVEVMYVMSDEYAVVDEVKQQVKSSGVRVVSLVPPKSHGHDSHAFRDHDVFQGISKQEAALLLFADLEMARRATVFVGTQSSNMGALVQALRMQHPKSAIDAGTGRPLIPFRKF